MTFNLHLICQNCQTLLTKLENITALQLVPIYKNLLTSKSVSVCEDCAGKDYRINITDTNGKLYEAENMQIISKYKI